MGWQRRWPAYLAALAILSVLQSISLAQPSASEYRRDIVDAGSSQNDYQVHAFYVVPSDRSIQAGAEQAFQDLLILYRDWFREQMEANGFGPKTFSLEMESDGKTPSVHVLQGTHPALYYGANAWGRVIGEAQGAGLNVGAIRTVWLGLYEGIVMNADGTLGNGYAGGLGNTSGYGYSSGTAIIDSICLAFGRKQWLNDSRPYGGITVPELGPYPMVQQVTFPWFLGDTFSQLSSSFYGIPFHELAHSFALAHDFRNDQNFSGNLLGNGHRGMRGWIEPDRYPREGVHLSYGDALALNVNRYFNPGQTWGDDILPSVTFAIAGNVTPVNGLIEIPYQASDNRQLAVALLRWNNASGLNTIDEAPLTGTRQNAVFRTAYYEPGKQNQYMISVFDAEGNRGEVTANLYVNAGSNQAPQANIHISPIRAITGQSVELDVSWSWDPDHPVNSLKVEWDLDGDGSFDTPPALEKKMAYSFAKTGHTLIRARLTDPAGTSAISAPIGLWLGDPPPRNAVSDWSDYGR